MRFKLKETEIVLRWVGLTIMRGDPTCYTREPFPKVVRVFWRLNLFLWGFYWRTCTYDEQSYLTHQESKTLWEYKPLWKLLCR